MKLAKPRLVFMANSMYSNLVSGGDNHTLHMAVTAIREEYPVHFFGGHAMKAELERRQIPATITLTDKKMMSPRNFDMLSSQILLFADYLVRLWGTLRQLSRIQPEDVVYSNSEFWWDALPTIACGSRRKLMFLGMDCPNLKEILYRSRPDIKSIRLPSLHYWMSQMSTLRLFRHCREKRMLYVHPNQKARLTRMGYRQSELFHISSGVDLTQSLKTPEMVKIYDVIWMGRAHHQKGMNDLLATLDFLAAQIEGFRAVIVGNVKDSMQPHIQILGLEKNVHFAGFVSEEEKFRLMKSSRVFLMPSRYESWGTVIAEALASGLPVVAYELDAYRPIFGNLLYYIKPFDANAFKKAAMDLVQKSRKSVQLLDQMQLAKFCQETTWTAAGGRFLNALRSLEN